MIVSKFGGTAISPRNLKRVKEIIEKSSSRLVVVSAVGKSHEKDVKTTDLLVDFHNTNDVKYWKKVCEKYKELVSHNQIDVDVDQLLADAFNRIKEHKSFDYTLSVGEELSAKIVAKFLNFDYLEAEDLVIFDNVLSIGKSAKKLKNAFKKVQKGAILGGFYGGSKFGRRVLERGGSDVTASLCANVFDARLINYVDVLGFCMASPKDVFCPKTIDCISFDDAIVLCKNGATVLHPYCISLLKKKNLCLEVKSFYNLHHNGTLVSNQSAPQRLLGLSAKRVGDKTVAKVVFSYLPNVALKRLAKTKLNFERAKVEANCLTIYCEQEPKKVVNLLYDTFAVDT